MLGTETKRLTTLLNDFLLFSRPSDAPKEYVDLSETLQSLLNRPDSDKNSDKKITLNVINNAEVVANRTFMEAALNNIIKNAIEAAKSEVKVSMKKVRGSEFGVQGSEKILIEIEDDGAGIEEEMKDKIFEPFVTTKANGTGLGLAIAYRIITSFGGNIIIDMSSLGGAKFAILFPVTTDY
jgi:signal transduction histidine kinase